MKPQKLNDVFPKLLSFQINAGILIRRESMVWIQCKVYEHTWKKIHIQRIWSQIKESLK